jgi:hypothetical protein
VATASTIDAMSALACDAKNGVSVSLKDRVFVVRTQEGHALDNRSEVVQPTAGVGIFDRSYTGPLGTEQATIRSHGLDEQFQCVGRVEDGVEPEPAK